MSEKLDQSLVTTSPAKVVDEKVKVVPPGPKLLEKQRSEMQEAQKSLENKEVEDKSEVEKEIKIVKKDK